MKKIAGLLAALGLTLVVAGCGADAADEAASGGLGESVGIEGYWRIDVVDADGSVAEHVEFHNEFVGQAFLTSVLLGEAEVGGWSVGLVPVEPSAPLCADALERCVTSASAVLGDDGESIVLTADIDPTFGGDIGAVLGYLGDSAGAVGSPFSQKDLTDAGGPGVVSVAAGQFVQVEVTYTFG